MVEVDGSPIAISVSGSVAALFAGEATTTTLCDGALPLAAGEHVTVSGDTGSATLPVGVADLPDGVVWTPTTSGSSGWSAPAGSVVRLASTNGVRE